MAVQDLAAQVGTTLDGETFESLLNVSDRTGLRRATIARDAIKQYLADYYAENDQKSKKKANGNGKHANGHSNGSKTSKFGEKRLKSNGNGTKKARKPSKPHKIEKNGTGAFLKPVTIANSLDEDNLKHTKCHPRAKSYMQGILDNDITKVVPIPDVFKDITIEKVASNYIEKAVRRSIKDRKRAARGKGPWIYNADVVEQFYRFVESIPALNGRAAIKGECFYLTPMQCWIASELLGWRRRGDTWERRFQRAVLFVGKKAGKSTFTAYLGLYELIYGDPGATIYCAAPTKRQADNVFKPARNMVASMQLRDMYKEIVPRAEVLKYHNATFEPLPQAKFNNEGLDATLVFADETALLRNRDSYEVLENSTAGRDNGLFVAMTTAQPFMDTAFYEFYTHAKDMLDDKIKDSRLFAALYEIDKGDDWTDKRVIVKANPNLGLTPNVSKVVNNINAAVSIPNKRTRVRTTHLNEWVKALDNWVTVEEWDACKVDAPPKNLKELPCFVGVDLSQSSDLSAVSVVWIPESGFEQYYVESRAWTTKAFVKSVSREIGEYFDVALGGERELRYGGEKVINHELLEIFIKQVYDQFNVQQICFDASNAGDIMNHLQDDGYPVMSIAQSYKKLNTPTKTCHDLIVTKRLKHRDDPFFSWQVGNVKQKLDTTGTKVMLAKEHITSERKIDAAAAMVFAMAGALSHKVVEHSHQFEVHAVE